jgi:transcription termination factor NusB
MNTIPEGKEMIWTEAVYKEPIEGVPFSNVGLTVGVSKYIEDDQREEVLEEQIDKLVKTYFDKLSKNVKNTRNELMDNLRKEISEEYEDRLEQAKQEVIRLYKLCEDNNINYKKD